MKEVRKKSYGGMENRKIHLRSRELNGLRWLTAGVRLWKEAPLSHNGQKMVGEQRGQKKEKRAGKNPHTC